MIQKFFCVCRLCAVSFATSLIAHSWQLVKRMSGKCKKMENEKMKRGSRFPSDKCRKTEIILPYYCFPFHFAWVPPWQFIQAEELEKLNSKKSQVCLFSSFLCNLLHIVHRCISQLAQDISQTIAWLVTRVLNERCVLRICISSRNHFNAHTPSWRNDWSTHTSQWYILHWWILFFDLGNFINLLEGYCACDLVAWFLGCLF